MRWRRSKTLHETVELNITAFLNLMVILVPFLLITAVFSRMTVLELNLPQLQSDPANPDQKVDLELQIIVRPESLELRDATVGTLQKFTHENETIAWQPIADLLLALKSRYPEETAVALLVDKRVPYKTLIAVMDQVRATEVVEAGTLSEIALFPDVSIGNAPELDEADTAEASP